MQVPLTSPSKALKPYQPTKQAEDVTPQSESIDEPSRCTDPPKQACADSRLAASKSNAESDDELRQEGQPKLPLTDGTFPRVKSVDFYDTDTEPDCAESSVDDCIIEAEADMRDSILRLHASPDDSYGVSHAFEA